MRVSRGRAMVALILIWFVFVSAVVQQRDALKVEQSDETRFRIGNYIKTHPELHEVIRRWGWVTLVLTPDEKLIAAV